MPTGSPTPEHTTGLVVWGLCAQWCGACREWRPVFDALAAAHTQAQFVWVDIEDQADTLGDVDVETFPTVLIARGIAPLFFGPLLPQPGALKRLVEAMAAPGVPPQPAAAEAHELLARLQGRQGLQPAQ